MNAGEKSQRSVLCFDTRIAENRARRMMLQNLWNFSTQTIFISFFFFSAAQRAFQTLWAFCAVRTLNVTSTPFDNVGLEARAFALSTNRWLKPVRCDYRRTHADCIHALGIPVDPHQFARLQCSGHDACDWRHPGLSTPCPELLALKKEYPKSENWTLYNLSAPRISKIDCHYSDLMECVTVVCSRSGNRK